MQKGYSTKRSRQRHRKQERSRIDTAASIAASQPPQANNVDAKSSWSKRLFENLEAVLGHPLTTVVITLVATALAVSGTFRFTGTALLLGVAWFAILLAVRKRGFATFVAGGVASAIMLGALALWFRPDVTPKFAGVLTPGGRVIFSEKTPHPRIEIGNSGAFVDQVQNGDLLLPFLRRDQLVVKLVGATYKFSAKVTDQNDKLIAEIVDNEWSTPPPHSFDRNYDDNALEVRDDSGDVVLQVQAFPDRIQVQGIWWSNSSPWGSHVRLIFYTARVLDLGITVPSRISNQALVGPVRNPPADRIEPLFVYPSALHLGERVPELPVGQIFPNVPSGRPK